MTALEIGANGFATASIVLAGRNSVHTWWTGILGCALFAWLFAETRLYADVTLQLAFIATSVAGWRWWALGKGGEPAPVTRAPPRGLALLGAVSVGVALGYGALLHHFTDAYAPFIDSFVLTLSLFGQLLLVRRQVETWPVWIAVNTIAVPLYLSRGLTLTGFLYAAYWCNAWYGWWRWHREASAC
ncbi:nicotinamide riboside transporter PnuC [uncultured Sphingomonas sp.]|uniref:nicotinamide riboside transporter PnuC n=1 Tax=uncultured Sphingomonas sp. TaxID=158754 RepID=UPI0025CD0664|nr:nicotinamide riboside transporter PnuC [uncultured Sphingomonas sp.]